LNCCVATMSSESASKAHRSHKGRQALVVLMVMILVVLGLWVQFVSPVEAPSKADTIEAAVQASSAAPVVTESSSTPAAVLAPSTSDASATESSSASSTASPAVVVESTTEQVFKIGDRVRCRDRRTHWAKGTVTGVDPLMVQRDGMGISFPYHEVAALTQEDIEQDERDNKEDHSPDCKMWAKLGECDSRPELLTTCAKSCQLAREGEAGKVLRADGLPVTEENLQFARRMIQIAQHGYDDSHHRVFTSETQLPTEQHDAGGVTVTARVVRGAGPKVWIVEGLVTSAEVDHVLEVVKHTEVQASPTYHEGGSPSRNSSTAFLGATSDDVLAEVSRRSAALVGRTIEAVEPLQMVRYKPGEYYKPHFDAASDVERQYTILLFLNSMPLGAGGCTRFPLLNMSFQPAAGTAVLWENLRELPSRREYRALHDGQPVVEGVKYALNIWIRAEGYEVAQ